MPLRLAILRDYPEEHWTSMDLCAEMLARHLPADVHGTLLHPPFRSRVSRFRPRPAPHIVDRLVNRQFDYPRFAKSITKDYDAFHIVDHSYAAVALNLPAERTGVYCHDLDAFRCLLEPAADPRPRWFRAMSRRILKGLQRVAVVFYSTHAVRDQILHYNLIDAGRLVHAPLGIAADFCPAGATTGSSSPYMLHVGSCIPRKRIDVLLQVFAALRDRQPTLRLVQIGGQFTAEQQALIESHHLGPHLEQVRNLTTLQLVDYYRRAAVLLQPSDAEGFGLPVAEALACGTPVVASAIPVLREVGGPAALYCAVGDIQAWTATVTQVLADTAAPPPLATRLAQAALYSWPAHAAAIAAAYQRLPGINVPIL